MILGLGIDVVEIERIRRSLERFGRRFLDRMLTAGEIRDVGGAMPAPHSVAGRFAAKEAAVKALGTGFSQGIGPTHMEVRRLSSGRPELIFHGPALLRCREMGVARSHLSLSHDRRTAAAVVVLEASP